MYRKHATFVSVVALFIVILLAARPAAAQDYAAIDSYIQGYMQANRIPGLALAIFRDVEIAHVQGFGPADATGRPITPQTPFILGSTSKSITALAVMQQVEAGEIDLDAPVRTYLPWFQVGSGDASAGITVRQLLNQTSGIPRNAGDDTLGVEDSSPDALEKQVRGLSRWQLSHRPGEAFEDANANYQAAGLIVQTVAEQPFAEYVQEHIFGPLEMTHSYASQSAAQADGLATGYRYWLGLPLAANNLPYPYQHIPSGYFISSAEDLGRFLIPQINDGRYRGQQILSPEGVALMHKPAGLDYTMGWEIRGELVVQDGAAPNYTSTLLIDPGRRIGVAMVFDVGNGVDNSRTFALAPNVWRLLTEAQPEALPSPGAYTTDLIWLAVVLVAAVGWLLWSQSWIGGWMRQPAARPRGSRAILLLGLPALVELGLGIALWNRMEVGLSVSLLFSPDVTILVVADVALLVGWCLARNVAYGLRLLREFLA